MPEHTHPCEFPEGQEGSVGWSGGNRPTPARLGVVRDMGTEVPAGLLLIVF